MSKTSTEFVRRALNGPTMGTRWSAALSVPADMDLAPVESALQAAVDEVDTQMSTWQPDSDLMRLNAAPLGEWIRVPEHLGEVLRMGVGVGRASGGAFDMGLGDVVSAWGFGPVVACEESIRLAMARARIPAHQGLKFDEGRVMKLAPLALDLNGLAKGYGVDRMAQVLAMHGIEAGLVGIDGEMRASGLRPDGNPWAVAIEQPDLERRAGRSVLELCDAAVATSGDYRHCVEVRGRRLSHTMDPRRGAPLMDPPASVTVVAQSCMLADAWATALMVLGREDGVKCARDIGLNALFIFRDPGGTLSEMGVGEIFGEGPSAGVPKD